MAAAAAAVTAEIEQQKPAAEDDYQFPPITLLKQNQGENFSEAGAELRNNSRRLAETLTSFGVDATAGDVVHGPSVTRYEFVLDQGVIVERGTHAQLLRRGGLYASMWNRQREAEAAREKLAEVEDDATAPNRNPPVVEEPEPAERAKAVWADIDRAFAEPMTRSDNSTDYVPTQIIAELFKREGLDGVGYKSSFGGDGFNLALFDLDAAELINCGLYRVDRVKIEASVAVNPYFIREFSEESG